MKKSFYSFIASMVMMVAFIWPSFADVLSDASIVAAADAVLVSGFELKASEPITIVDDSVTANKTDRVDSGGFTFANSKQMTACMNCHVKATNQHKSLNSSYWQKIKVPNDVGKFSLARFEPGSLLRPG